LSVPDARPSSPKLVDGDRPCLRLKIDDWRSMIGLLSKRQLGDPKWRQKRPINKGFPHIHCAQTLVNTGFAYREFLHQKQGEADKHVTQSTVPEVTASFPLFFCVCAASIMNSEKLSTGSHLPVAIRRRDEI